VIPYRGLEPFEKEQAKFFFGREQVVADIWNALNQSNFVAVIGASGSGKSSTIRAGVIPQLEKSGWQVLKPMTPGTAPLAKLINVFEPFFESIRNQKQLEAFIYTDPEGLRRVTEHLSSSQRLLLLVDQFEEVFTLSRLEEKNRFIELLTQVAELPQSKLAVVMTMRADFLEPCLKYSALTQLIQDYSILMKPLTPAELQQAIEEPAKKQGYSLESGLLGEILQEVRQEPGCLPLLQFALRQLWERRDRENHQLTCSAYREIGGAIGALNLHAEELYQKLSEAEQRWVKMVCLNLTRTGGEEKDTRQRQPKQELLRLAADSQNQLVLNTVLTMLVDERQLVTGKEDSGEAWVDLAHEALMEGWERFAKWRKEDRELRRLRDRVEDERRDWQEHEQNDDYLISGGLLVQVTKRWTELKPYLHVTAQEFYQLSYERDREKTSYAAGVSHFKERLQELQGKLSERLEEMERLRLARESSKASNLPSEPSEASRAITESSSLEDVDESRYIKLSEEIRDFLWRAQGYEQRMYFSHVAADWLSSNQETLVELIVQYSLSKNPQLTSDGEPADSPEQVQHFYGEINRYIDWLQESLRRGLPVGDNLELPSILPRNVYAEAFEFLKQEWLSDRLSGDAIKELQLYLDYLINYFLYFD
jgi:type II secretory pathway predicted ATPase ExeA